MTAAPIFADARFSNLLFSVSVTNLIQRLAYQEFFLRFNCYKQCINNYRCSGTRLCLIFKLAVAILHYELKPTACILWQCADLVANLTVSNAQNPPNYKKCNKKIASYSFGQVFCLSIRDINFQPISMCKKYFKKFSI